MRNCLKISLLICILIAFGNGLVSAELEESQNTSAILGDPNCFISDVPGFYEGGFSGIIYGTTPIEGSWRLDFCEDGSVYFLAYDITNMDDISGSGTIDGAGLMNMTFEGGTISGTGSIDCAGNFDFEVPDVNFTLDAVFDVSSKDLTGSWEFDAAVTGSCDGGLVNGANLSVSVISCTQVDIAWIDNLDNELGFIIERKTGSGTFSEIGAVGKNVTNYSDNAASPDSTNIYRVRGWNACGKFAYSNEPEATTPACSCEPPDKPGNLSGYQTAPTQIDLSWIDNSDDENGFLIERKANGGPWQDYDTVGANETSYADTGVVANTSYNYQVRAYNTCGYSAPSNATGIIVMPETAKFKATVLGASAAMTSDLYMREPDDIMLIENVTHSVGKTTDASYAQGTELIFSIVIDGTEWGLGEYEHRSDSKYCRIDVISDSSWILYFEDLPDTHPAYDGDYNDVVVLIEVLQEVAGVPAAPSGCSAEAQSFTEIEVSWTDNSDNEDGFNIFRLSEDGVWTQIGSVGTDITSYSDQGVIPFQVYLYAVEAYNANGSSNKSNIAMDKTGFDFDGNGEINIFDVMKVVNHWNTQELRDAGFESLFDLDVNNEITIVDIMKTVNQWGWEDN